MFAGAPTTCGAEATTPRLGLLARSAVACQWASITSVTRGHLALRTLLDSRMGLTPGGGLRHPPVPAWLGPGRAFTGFSEYQLPRVRDAFILQP